MRRLFETITEFDTDAAREALRRRRYGVIEATGGRVTAIHLRPWPKLISWPEFWPAGSGYRTRGPADRCYLYYNQPRGSSNFLALKYIVSTADTSFHALRAAVCELDRIAELKRTDAIVCDAANLRISDRLLARFGWEPHAASRWHRNFIKRFYGMYPAGRSV
jgi:hypothetical protein